MSGLRCPMCAKTNPEELDTCRFCGARLTPLTAPPASDSRPIPPGQAGETPAGGEADQSLPGWLRNMREGMPAGSESAPGGAGADDPPALQADAEPGGIPDWLSGLNTSGKSQAESGDWLSGLRSAGTTVGGPLPDDEQADGAEQGASPELIARLEKELGNPPPPDPLPARTSPPEAAAPAGLPDWMQALSPQASAASLESGAPDWLGTLGTEPAASAVTPAGQDQGGVVSPPDAGPLPESAPARPAEAGGEPIPAWLSDLPSVPSEAGPAAPAAPAEGLPDWLNQLKEKAIAPEGALPGQEADGGQWPDSGASLPGDLQPETGSDMPAWVARLNPQGSQAAPEQAAAPGGTPDWLNDLKADVNTGLEAEAAQEQFEVADSQPARKESSPLPAWLAGIERPAAPAASTPALISEHGASAPEGRGAAFAMETPDWLSKLKPENEPEPVPEQQPESTGQNLAAADLPSWVQAMRPVEAVMDGTRSNAAGQQEIEQNGPLAGLRGVLPASPGLGALRKPPAYTAKLQVSEGQQRHAGFLEKLVSGEAEPKVTTRRQAESGRGWRWVITLLLGATILAALLVAPPAQPTSLEPSDQGAAMAVVDSLPQGAVILAAFDYDPALSGELEALAAPLFDQLLSRGSHLTLISTSPTGPLLADRFLHYTPLVNVHQASRGVNFNNLGFLAGGPSGIQFFAAAPRTSFSHLKTSEGGLVWDSAPLQAIQGLSDFAAVIILTDNADTGRSWIEQAGPYLGDRPMLLIVSAQAEPMIRPYFDSGQIAGLVTGLWDAKVYEQAYGRPGLAQAYWNPLSYGMLAAELILVFGALWNLLAGVRERQHHPRKGS